MEQKPTPADFDLTEDQVAAIRRPKPPGIWSRLNQRYDRLIGILGWIAATAWFGAGFTKLLPGTIFFLGPPILLLGLIVIAVLVGLLQSLRTTPLQAQHDRYDQYISALTGWEAHVVNERDRLEREELRKRRHWWRGLSAGAFEYEVAETFRRKGHEVHVLGGRGDGGIDILVDSTVIVQCKAHKTRIGPAVVRELCGARHMSRASSAILVAREGCSSEARQLAEREGIRILTLDDLVDLDSGPRPAR